LDDDPCKKFCFHLIASAILLAACGPGPTPIAPTRTPPPPHTSAPTQPPPTLTPAPTLTLAPTSVGCPHGGTLAFETSDEGYHFTLNACAFSKGFALTGDGTYASDADRFLLDVAVGGPAKGKLTYVRESDGKIGVTGTYGGKKIELSQAGSQP